MEVKALKTFKNSQTGMLTRAGETFDADEQYAGDLQKLGIIEPAGATTSASLKGMVPQPQRTQAAGGPPFVGSKSLDGGGANVSSSSVQGPASASKTVVTPPAPAKR